MVPVRNESQYLLLESFPETPVHLPVATNACLPCPRPPQKQRMESIADDRFAPVFPFPLDLDEDDDDDDERMLHSIRRISLQPHSTSHSFTFAALGTSRGESRDQLPWKAVVFHPNHDEIMACPKIPLRCDHDLARAPSHVLPMKHRNRGTLSLM